MADLTATHHAGLEPIVPGDALPSVSLSADGDLVALWSTPVGTVRITLARFGPDPRHVWTYDDPVLDGYDAPDRVVLGNRHDGEFHPTGTHRHT